MRRQLERLIEVADKPNVVVDIIPFSAGLYPRHEKSLREY